MRWVRWAGSFVAGVVVGAILSEASGTPPELGGSGARSGIVTTTGLQRAEQALREDRETRAAGATATRVAVWTAAAELTPWAVGTATADAQHALEATVHAALTGTAVVGTATAAARGTGEPLRPLERTATALAR